MRQIAVLFLLLILPAAHAAQWRVVPGESLADVVQRAAPGDEIIVERGVYAGNLQIDKPLTLSGHNRPTLHGGNHGDVIRITAPDVTVQGFIVTHSGDDLEKQNAGIYVYPGSHRALIRNNDIAYSLFGLWIEKANDVRIENNLITGKRDILSSMRGNGIQLYNTSGAKIIGNRICFTRDAIYVDVSHHALFRGNHMHHSRYGTHYMNSYHNVWEYNQTYLNRAGLALMEVRNQIVRYNIAWGNSDHGIMLRTIQDAVVENNIVAGNSRGFFVYDAEYNTLRGNLVIGNNIGVHLMAGSTRNHVDANDFIQNRDQVRYVGSRDELWGQQQGNYWSNYMGWDRNGDKVGDVRYEAADVVDRLIWRHPFVKLLLNSPAISTLRLVARQFPLLRAPSVVDNKPAMSPHRSDWSKWLGKRFDSY
jgi:nitrous oxidase accessory protein